MKRAVQFICWLAVVFGVVGIVSAEIFTPNAFAQTVSQGGTTFVVNTTDGASDGACNALTATTDCSLTDAIEAANASIGFNAIEFDIPGTGPFRITPTVPFPEITQPVSIDGLTQNGATCPDGMGGGNLLIELNGSPHPFGTDGFRITNMGSTIRGFAIFSFDGDGIEANGFGEHVIECNHLGTDASGTASGIGNSGSGLYLNNSSDNLVQNNVLSGNDGQGIDLRFGANNNVTQNNLIGTDHTGMAALANGSHGYFEGTSTANSRILNNVASGNTSSGIVVKDSDNQIIGNLVGVDRTGNNPLGNGANGVVVGPAFDSLVQSNTIAHNAVNGVNVFNITTRRVTIIENSIHSNGDIGIDLYRDVTTVGVSPNDPAPDADLFANELQNFPVLTSAESTLSTITISGTLESAFSSQYRLDFYASDGCDSSGHGEGETHLGTTNVTTDVSGMASFEATFSKVVQADEVITATATDAAGNTSEFSACLQTFVPTHIAISRQRSGISHQWPVVFGLLSLLLISGWLFRPKAQKYLPQRQRK